MFKTMIAHGPTLQSIDSIEYANKKWIVASWLEHKTEGYRIPGRLIRFDDHRHQHLGLMHPTAEYALSVPIPIGVLDGSDPHPEQAGFEILDQPDLRFPKPAGPN